MLVNYAHVGSPPVINSCIIENGLAVILARISTLIIRPVQFRPDDCPFETYAVYRREEPSREGSLSASAERTHTLPT